MKTATYVIISEHFKDSSGALRPIGQMVDLTPSRSELELRRDGVGDPSFVSVVLPSEPGGPATITVECPRCAETVTISSRPGSFSSRMESAMWSRWNTPTGRKPMDLGRYYCRPCASRGGR